VLCLCRLISELTKVKGQSKSICDTDQNEYHCRFHGSRVSWEKFTGMSILKMEQVLGKSTTRNSRESLVNINAS